MFVALHRFLRWLSPVCVVATALIASIIFPRQAASDVPFNQQIRPLLAHHCGACHGPDESSRQADLRLDTFVGATADRGGYQAIAPGNAAASEVLARIVSVDDPMPPEGHPRLNSTEVALLTRWIAEGAAYEVHWSFAAVHRPEIPFVSDDNWSRGSIDRFVLARMTDRSLVPNPSADPRRLVRRLALDLIGLPPKQEMVASFAKDPSPKHYEAIVDQLLADPAFGEHWASMWLDLARYADTVGYAGDEERTIWPWRDWVIRALNENMPFDEFTTWQLAGDLLENSKADQRLATAFHRNTLNNNEGGTNDEEFRLAAVKDRASTTASTWLGLTLRCAECHSHKFDPISQQEYYQFLDFFNQTADADRPDETPVMEVAAASRSSATPALVPVLQGLPADEQRATFVMQRGDFRSPGNQVFAAVPDFLHDWPTEAPLDRLGLASWLMSEDNPLTARVTVNRFWSRLFGRGLVETEEDFGTQGSLPSHPHLLDWLAVEFRESGWNIKRLLKSMVMSSTYQQSALASAEKWRADPANIWLARGPRTRLAAEVVRDQALAISGLLSRKMYGPPVYPPNPIREVTNAFKGTEVWTESEGEDRYRRAIYTFLKRSQPHPLFETFDMATRDVCSLRRILTNTPLQCLMTLNGRGFVEAAQALATRMAQENTPRHQIAAGMRLAVFREPQAAELDHLLDLYQRSSAMYRDNSAAAGMMLGRFAEPLDDQEIIMRASLTVVANVILNLDEVLNK